MYPKYDLVETSVTYFILPSTDYVLDKRLIMNQ